MKTRSRFAQITVAVLLSLCIPALSSCVAWVTIENQPLTCADKDDAAIGKNALRYSIHDTREPRAGGDTVVMLAFSGGGARAAALAYGVMKTLRDTPVSTEGVDSRLLDYVGGISAVSGGSFTAAYYGLYGDELFSNFESDFLRRDVTGTLIRQLWNPLRWFSHYGRTDAAVDYFDRYVFKGATFADLKFGTGPMILINATDLGNGVHVPFVQEYFDFLCSDLSSFPVSRAVVASSAVPVVFQPVVLKRYSGCSPSSGLRLDALTGQGQSDAELALLLDGLGSYQSFDDQQAYVHLVDGGISDNLGLRTLFEIFALAGGPQAYFRKIRRTPPERMVVISVNASVRQHFHMNESNRRPSVEETLLATSELQLRRYNATTLNLIQSSLKHWSRELSDENRTARSWFINLDFNDIRSDTERDRLNAIPTTLSLSRKQVDLLVSTGQMLLKQDETFQGLLADLNQ